LSSLEAWNSPSSLELAAFTTVAADAAAASLNAAALSCAIFLFPVDAAELLLLFLRFRRGFPLVAVALPKASGFFTSSLPGEGGVEEE
jgi:hypothetical protein